jgi:type VI secretion system protein ImpM
VAGPTTGYFGKLPGLGDFAHRGLPSSFVLPWDGWLQHTLPASRALVGPAWFERYLASPFWRFVLAPGVCGPQGWMGVLMPSADRVGRPFPLTLARSAPAGPGILELARHGGLWFLAVEDLLLSALHPVFGPQRLDRDLAALPDLEPPAGLPATGGTVRPGATSCWSTAGPAQEPARLQLWRGLPPAPAYAALLGATAAPDAT